VSKTLVAGGALSLVRLRDTTNPLVAFGYSHRGIGGTIVDHDDFEVSMGLSQNTLDRLAEKTRLVVAGDDDGNQLAGGSRDPRLHVRRSLLECSPSEDPNSHSRQSDGPPRLPASRSLDAGGTSVRP
jgi:hypothetical protein